MKSAGKRIRVLIADDHPVVREGLRQIISRAPDMVVGGEAVTGQEVLDRIQDNCADVVILDLGLPGKDGFEVLRTMKKISPRPPVLVLSMHHENQVGVRVFQAGAAGFMNKETVPDQLLHALRRIHVGGKYVSPALAEKLAGMLDLPIDLKPHELLSNREYQVLCRIASGESVDRIATEVSISVKTVRTYRDRIMTKLKATNDVELTHYALKHGLIE